MRSIKYRCPGYKDDIDFLLNVAKSLFSINNKEYYLADKEPRYSSGYRVTQQGIRHEFWHYSKSDAVLKWPKDIIGKIPELNSILERIKTDMLQFVNKEISETYSGNQINNNPEEYITRVRFVKYQPSDNIRFEEHIDSGAATFFMFETSPGLQIMSLDNDIWYKVQQRDYPLMILSGSSEEALNIPAIYHRVINGKEERYSCAIFLHGKDTNITNLLKGKQ